MHKQSILILCTGNSARSQMAEGLMRDAAGERFDIFSAGTRPSYVRTEAIEAMREMRIDISQHRSKSVDEFKEQPFDYIITVCDNARDACPQFPGKGVRLHWPFEDPAVVEGTNAERIDAFRKVRDQIRTRIQEFMFKL